MASHKGCDHVQLPFVYVLDLSLCTLNPGFSMQQAEPGPSSSKLALYGCSAQGLQPVKTCYPLLTNTSAVASDTCRLSCLHVAGVDCQSAACSAFAPQHIHENQK